MSTNKQALRGQHLPERYYLAECQECGEIMPSNKLIVSRNFQDGDADCYCPHCNANDCDIADLGSADEPAAAAWNYQQKRIEALLDELEAAEKQIAELAARSVKLPEGYATRIGHPINESERSVMIPKDGGQWLSRFDVEHALRVAGIRFNGEV